MQLSHYVETLTDPLFAIVDLTLERPFPVLGFAAAATVVLLAVL